MKKLLVSILLCSSALAFADSTSFQDFNNNAYLQVGNTFINEGQSGNSDGYTLGTTIQTKNNIWLNVSAYGSAYDSNNWPGTVAGKNVTFGGSTYGQFLATVKAGYAFQFLNGNSSGFQEIPYATFTYGTSLGALNQYYGLGSKSEYRLHSFKFSLDATAYEATQSGGNSIPAVTNPAYTNQLVYGEVQDFRYTINPEVQYDVSNVLLLAVGYAYDQSFNSQPNVGNGTYSDGNSTAYVRVGYLF